MAEVPEVETLVRDLQGAVIGRTIVQVTVALPAAVRFPEPDEYAAMLRGRTICAAQRWAKHILLPLSDDLVLEAHLMLWGTLALVPTSRPLGRETLVIWHLDGDEDLRFTDTLGYARTGVALLPELVERLDLASLGPDALDPTFDAAVLERQLARRRGVLKSVLLNQRIVAGLGNRDADESMWLAGIDPRRSAASLAQDEITLLHAAMIQILNEGLDLRGTQRDLFGRQGQAKHRRYVFERGGKPCPRCATPIAHLRIGGRNTHYCPQCQR